MEITFGNEIKINGEELPEYLCRALYAHLARKYEKPRDNIPLCAGEIQAQSIQASALKVEPSNLTLG